ncbi:MAG TPA: response regulator [Flavisolibacter sp.]|nr:response regulator [Flavisolibacter sp.]
MDIKKAPIKSILLIDDDCDDCSLFEGALKEVSSTLQFTALNRCEDVLRVVDDCCPDVIFVDINIPKVDGFSCISLLQESAKHCRIPIVIYSSSNSQREMNAAYGYGASLFFKKPTRYVDLLDSLRGIIIMDWDRPELIKQQYFREGKYHSFTL